MVLSKKHFILTFAQRKRGIHFQIGFKNVPTRTRRILEWNLEYKYCTMILGVDIPICRNSVLFQHHLSKSVFAKNHDVLPSVPCYFIKHAANPNSTKTPRHVP